MGVESDVVAIRHALAAEDVHEAFMQRHARCLAHDEPGQFSRFAQEKETTTSSHSSSCRVVSTTECRNCPPTRLAPLRRDSLRCQLARVGNEARQTACNPVQSA